MRKCKRKQRVNKETETEDWCFVCKDGGQLIICEYGNCLKVYHPGCVGKDDSLLDNGKRWTCNCHSCLRCHKTPKFHCFCCPNAVCARCVNAANFVPASGKNGFCYECLELVLLAEEKVEYDSDGGKIDFTDRDTYEGLFKEYWEIIKEKEGLTLDDVYTAKAKIKKIGYFSSGSGSVKFGEDEKELTISDCDMYDMEEYKPFYKRRQPKVLQFSGWGSKPLIEFLKSLGTDTTKQLSQYDVDSIISEYIRENNLLDPQNRKKVICDEKLRALLGKKSVSKRRIPNLLDAHFAENLVQSEDDGIENEDRSNLEDKSENLMVACQRQRTPSSDKKSAEVEVEIIMQQTGYASIVAENINLVYLRRSLVEELLKDHENFEGKAVGSFVKVKADPRDYLQKNSHQLLQVTGIKETLAAGKMSSEILLQASCVPLDIHISMLSDSDFTEEECDDLRQKMNSGLLRKPTVVELEQKARSLHADIMKQRIERELVLLQNQIDRANEKGWRRELYQFLDRRELLKKASEQQRLMNQQPKVLAEVVEVTGSSGDLSKQGFPCSPQSILAWNPKTPCT
ncbi:uncharacterized protein At5g08430 isoform X1 [Juglans microcarpa x Juglans regia]|uniref:uncharacterized protein At5g08430 isoform X1 n=1 Tax=Juglans microcarpa x Juglans regia TaxID=2249226 RepID=UPI001B7E27D9|nr:uncharacterized protein At5g08430 isoform X1 [Juglans microcarpa x Juglans regia]